MLRFKELWGERHLAVTLVVFPVNPVYTQMTGGE